MSPTHSNILEGQDKNKVLVTYNIIWMSTNTGKNERTGGRIEIMPVQHEVDGSGRQPLDEVEEDLLIDTKDEGSEADLSYQSTSAPDVEKTVSTQISWNIPCIAHFYWGAWKAEFYCNLNPHTYTFPSAEDGLYPFAIRGMNEWMEMALAGHPVTVPRIVCASPDDHGNTTLRFEITWRQQGLATNTSTLYAKRVTGSEDWELSKTESHNIPVPSVIHNTQLMIPQVAQMQCPGPKLADHDDERLNQSRGRVTRGSPRGRGGRVSGATGRGVFRGRDGFRGRTRGRVVRLGGHGRGASRGLA